jgi:hypothetical protein
MMEIQRGLQELRPVRNGIDHKKHYTWLEKQIVRYLNEAPVIL